MKNTNTNTNTNVYDLYGDPVSDRRLTYISRYLERFCPNMTSGNILDLGVGQWEYISLLTKQNMRVIGLDISSDLLKIARDHDDVNVNLIRGDLAHLPFKNGVFDLIICLSVLEHLNNPEKLVQKIKLLSKEAGVVIINIPWLWDILFHPVMTIFHRVLDSIRKGKPNLFALVIFSSIGSSTINELKLRRWIFMLIRNDSRRDSIEKYANAHISGKLEHFDHKHWFTPNEWIMLLKDCGLTILSNTGSYTVPPYVHRIPGGLRFFYWIEDHLPNVVRKWLGQSFVIVVGMSSYGLKNPKFK